MIDQTERDGFIEASEVEACHGIPTRYEILDRIGFGGMGIVYKVRDLETEEVIALKVLKPDIAADQVMRENLRREVCLARKVTHKNVCRIHEFNRSNATACISMEFVEGESLLSRLQRTAPLSVAESIEIARQICAGLREAHVNGIVHRDLKPANVMVDASSNVKIMDFGIARLSQDNATMTGTITGTPAYMAPEQIELKPMGPWTDIYSLGLLLYEMVTGSPAFAGDTPIALALKQIRELPKRPSEINPALPTQMEAIILRCLRKDPEKRFQSVDEVDAALKKAVTITSPAAALAELKAHPRVHYGFDKGRAMVSEVIAFAGKAWRVSLEANRFGKKLRGNWNLHERARDLRARIRPAQLTAIVGAIVLTTVVSGSAISKQRHQNRPAAEVPSVAAFSLTPTKSPAIRDGGAPLPQLTDDGAPATQAGFVSTENVSLTQDPDSAVPDSSLSEASTSKSIRPSRVTFTDMMKKAAKRTHVSAPSPISAASAGNQGQSSLSADINTAPAPTESVASVTEPKTSAVVAAQSSATTANGTVMSGQPRTEESKPDLAAGLLDVGSFKDAKWADDAVERLSQLGFNAICIQKGHLWVKAYHVEVGPYATGAELEAAEEHLSALGFTTHLVK